LSARIFNTSNETFFFAPHLNYKETSSRRKENTMKKITIIAFVVGSVWLAALTISGVSASNDSPGYTQEPGQIDELSSGYQPDSLKSSFTEKAGSYTDNTQNMGYGAPEKPGNVAVPLYEPESFNNEPYNTYGGIATPSGDNPYSSSGYSQESDRIGELSTDYQPESIQNNR
jgi:hypothetical protein